MDGPEREAAERDGDAPLGAPARRVLFGGLAVLVAIASLLALAAMTRQPPQEEARPPASALSVAGLKRCLERDELVRATRVRSLPALERVDALHVESAIGDESLATLIVERDGAGAERLAAAMREFPNTYPGKIVSMGNIVLWIYPGIDAVFLEELRSCARG
jgi:hypothetical protein